MSEQKEMTAEQYKTQRLKTNFANRVTDYEDVIADLQTQVAMLQQALQQAQQDNNKKGAPEPVVDAEELDLDDLDLEPA